MTSMPDAGCQIIVPWRFLICVPACPTYGSSLFGGPPKQVTHFSSGVIWGLPVLAGRKVDFVLPWFASKRRRVFHKCELTRPTPNRTKEMVVVNPRLQSQPRQCIMKERPDSEGRVGCGAASAALRCAGLRSATAALESKCVVRKGLQESIGKSAGEWHFTLGER